jgi:hypothetical protein
MPLPAVLTRLVFSLPGPPCRVWEDRDECTEEEEEEEEEEVGGEGGPHLQREALTLPVWAPLRPMEMVTALSLVWMARETPARRMGAGPARPKIVRNPSTHR